MPADTTQPRGSTERDTTPVRTAMRRIVVVLASVAVVWAFGRVGLREWRAAFGAADGSIELVVMHWSGDGGQQEDAIVEGLLRSFEERNPGIRVRRINPGDAGSFYTKLQTMMASGDPPDLFYVGAERLASFVSLGLVAPLDDLVAASRDAGPQGLDLDAFYPATVDAFRYDGERVGGGPLWGVPKDFTTVGFYWNRDLFDRAGAIHPTDDWTWDDFIAAARTIGELPDATGAEFVTWAMMMRAYLWTEGIDVRGDSWDDLRLDDPRVLETFDRLRAWRQDEDNALTSGRSRIVTGSSVFLTGKVGMAGPFGRWVVPSYRGIPSSADGGFDWDFAPLPRGRERANVIATVAWSIAERSEHREEAFSLLSWLVSPEAQAAQSRLGLAIPTLRAVAESDAFIDAEAAPVNDRAFLDAAEIARVADWPADPRFEQLFSNRIDQALKTGNLSVRDALEDFGRSWRRVRESPLAGTGFPRVRWSIVWIGVVLVATAIAGLWWASARRVLKTRAARAEQRAGLALVSPWVIGFAIFMAGPILVSFVLSLSKWSGLSTLGEARFVGLANYTELFAHDERFRTSLRVTLWYVVLAVPGGQAVAIAAALLMNMKVRGIELFRAAYYLPSVLAGVGTAVLWRWVFDTDAGLANALLGPPLRLVGLSPPDWFGNDAAIFGAPAFAIMSLWMVGGAMMIYLAGLRNIPRELHEAAAIDGLGAFRRFTAVTLPMLSPVILFNGVMAIIGSFQVFTQAFVMTGGEPGDLTRFYVLYLYDQAFIYYEMGYASALAWILLVVVLVLTIVVMRVSGRFVHYEGLKS